MTTLKVAAFLFVVIYYGLLIVFRGYLLYKKTGINPIGNLEKTGMEGFIERVFGICFVMISVIAFNYTFLENNYQYFLVPIPYLEITWISNVGIILSIIGLGLGFLAQYQMGDSWRLGLNKNEKTKLVKSGVFRYSRNPIYLGILIANIGFFLMLPNAFSFCLVVVSYIALEIKIGLEEQYLETTHSKDYLSYKQKVRKWI